jgi:hypothetical protein
MHDLGDEECPSNGESHNRALLKEEQRPPNATASRREGL